MQTHCLLNCSKATNINKQYSQPHEHKLWAEDTQALIAVSIKHLCRLVFATTRLTPRRTWLHTSWVRVQSQVKPVADKVVPVQVSLRLLCLVSVRILPHQRSEFVHHPGVDTSGRSTSLCHTAINDHPTNMVTRPPDVTLWFMNRPII